ncbi:MAG: hypothetical protein ACM31P_09460 [Actinomycetota bacterium]
MANRAYLLNTPTLTGDPYSLQAALRQGPQANYAEIAEVSYRVPLPWFCCFRGAQLTEVHVPLEYWGQENGPDELTVHLPCIDVATAWHNLQASLETFQEMAGDTALGEGYWQRACEGLAELPLPYLAMNPIEVLLMGYIAEAADKFSACFKSQLPPMELLKFWAGYHEGFQPFSAEDFYSRSPAELDHAARLDSSRALDAGYLGGDYYWHCSKPDTRDAQQTDTSVSQLDQGVGAGARKRPWWRLW